MSTIYDNKKNVEFLDGGISPSSEDSQSAVAQPVKENEELNSLPASEEHSLDKINKEIASYQERASHAMELVDDIVLKNYLTKLSMYEVVPCNDLNTDNVILFKINKMVYEKDEYVTDKFISVVSAMTYTNSSIFLIVDGYETHTDFYLGIKSEDEKRQKSTIAETFKNSILGQFPGAEIEDYSYVKVNSERSKQDKLLHRITEAASVSSCVGIPSYKNSKGEYTNANFIQGIEKFTTAMQGKKYTAIILASNMPKHEIDMYKDNPDYCLFFHTLANLYPDTPLAEDIAGSIESVTEITVEDLDENFETFYHPSNMSLLLIGNFDLEKTIAVIQEQHESLKGIDEESLIRRFPLALNPVISTGSVRMEVANSKLAIGLRGSQSLAGTDLFRYKTALKLLFAMMFGWISKRFQTLYEAGKIDNSLSLEVEVEKDFHFVMLTMDTSEPVALSHQFRSAIRDFEKDPDVTEEHLDIIKSEMFGDFLHGLNSLEYIATQYETFSEGDNLFDLPKILQTISLVDVIEIGHHFIDSCEMIDFTILPNFIKT